MNYSKNENTEEPQENNIEIKKLKYQLIKLATIIVENIIKDNFSEELMFHIEGVVECVNVKSSLLLRRFYEDLFQSELPSPDLLNLDCIFSYDEFPNIFSEENPSENQSFNQSLNQTQNTFSISTNIINLSQKKTYSELLSLKSETKSFQNFFEKYKTFYPYDQESGKKCFSAITSAGRFRNHELFMLWFPEYFFLYKNTLDTILENKEGFLPLSWKVYLGIMAAATLRSEFLLKSLEADFILLGGDEEWLVFGLAAVPEKIRKLEILNNIMAHQPWKLKIQDIKDVCGLQGASAWNIEDLVQSVIVLSTFHRLATVLESMRISVRNFKEADKDKEKDSLSEIGSLKGSFSVKSGGGKVKNNEETYNDNQVFCSSDKKDKVEEEDRAKSENQKIEISNDEAEEIIIDYKSEEGIKNKILNELEIMNNSNDDQPISKQRKNSQDFINIGTKPVYTYDFSESRGDFSKYISKYCTVYLDFDIHSEKYLSYLIFNWEDQGCHILSNIQPKAIKAINEEIEFLINLTSNNIGGVNIKVDTTKYRDTISAYVEKIYGFDNEFFDYSKFMKNVASCPQKIQKFDISVLKVTFSIEEIFHIIMLVAALKQRIQLTYFAEKIYSITTKQID